MLKIEFKNKYFEVLNISDTQNVFANCLTINNIDHSISCSLNQNNTFKVDSECDYSIKQISKLSINNIHSESCEAQKVLKELIENNSVINSFEKMQQVKQVLLSKNICF
jgi:hypothetical protein